MHGLCLFKALSDKRRAKTARATRDISAENDWRILPWPAVSLGFLFLLAVRAAYGNCDRMGRMQDADNINKMQQFYLCVEERAFHEAFKVQDVVKFVF